MFDLSKKRNQLLTLFFLASIWGSSFILMKRGLQSYTPTEITLFRIFIVFLVFLPFGIRDILSSKLKTKIIILISAILGSAIPYYLFVKAQTKIDSSLNGVLNSMTPLFTLVFGVILFKLLTPILVGPLRKMRPIQAEIVARAMIKLANENIDQSVFESNEISNLVG